MKFLILIISIASSVSQAARFSLDMSQGDIFDQQMEITSANPFGLGGGIRIRGDFLDEDENDEFFGVIVSRYRGVFYSAKEAEIAQSTGFDIGISEKGNHFLDTRFGLSYMISQKSEFDIGVKYQIGSSGQSVASYLSFGGRF